jgi:hypothetical protein
MTTELNQQNKQLVWDFWQSLESAGNEKLAAVAEQHIREASIWHGPDPINELQGANAFISDFWQPLLHSFPNLQRQCHIFLGGVRRQGISDFRRPDSRETSDSSGSLHGFLSAV